MPLWVDTQASKQNTSTLNDILIEYLTSILSIFLPTPELKANVSIFGILLTMALKSSNGYNEKL